MRTPCARTAAAAFIVLATTFGSCVSPPETEPPWRGPRLALIGANGQRLGPAAPYWLPLGAAERPIPLRTPLREALAVRNEGDASLTVEGIWLVPLGDAVPGEFALLEPSRAAEVPLTVERTTLRPGEQLDLDLGVWLAASGVRRAVVTARWVEGADVAVEVRALGAGAERLWDPANVVPPTGVAATPPWTLEALAAAVTHGNAYVTARATGGAAGPAATVTRILPDGGVAWTTAVAAVAGAPFAPRGVCAGGQSVILVGYLETPLQEPAAVALDSAGGLRWTRTWDGSAGEAGGALLHCSIAGERVWLAGHEAQISGGPPARSIVLAASLADGALAGSWLTEARPEAVAVVDLAAAPDGGGAVLAEVRGKVGALLRIGPDGVAELPLPGAAAALALLSDGDVAVAWREPGATVLGRVGAAGAVRWSTALPAFDVVRVRVDGDQVAVVGDDGSGWTVAWLCAGDGALRSAASLHLGAAGLDLGAASVGADGLGLVGLGDAGGVALWYAATPAWAPRGVRVFSPRPAALDPIAGRWEAAGTVSRPAEDLLRASAGGGASVVLTGLRRSGSE